MFLKLKMEKLLKIIFITKKTWAPLGIFGLFFLPAFYLTFIYMTDSVSLKNGLQKFKNQKPQLLQKVTGSILGDGVDIRVNKVKHKDKIYLDFLSQTGKDTFYFKQSLVLKGKHEGFFDYWDESLSLALVDENGDGYLEIIAPTFDSFFRPHLNVVFYNKKTTQFELKKTFKKPTVISK